MVDKEELKNELRLLKQELQKKKKEISSLQRLLDDEIRQPSIWELSDKELEAELGSCLEDLEAGSDPRPGIRQISSHRPGIGSLIVFLKKIFLKFSSPYTNLLLSRQSDFNHKSSRIHQILFLKTKRQEEKLVKLTESLSKIEEDLAIIEDKLSSIQP